LQGVHLPHTEGEPARNGHPLLRLAQGAIAGFEYGPRFMPALGWQGLNHRRNRPVQQEREQERGRDRLVLGHTRIGIVQALQDQLLHQAAWVLLQVTIDGRKQRREQIRAGAVPGSSRPRAR